MSPAEYLYKDDWLSRHEFNLSTGERLIYWLYQPEKPSDRLALFVHGMKGNHSGLAALAWEYKENHPDDTILIPDLPGYGVSEPFKTITNATLSSSYVTTIGELLAHTAQQPHLTIIGHSFGAVIAYSYLALTQNSRIDKAYLFGTHADGRALNGRLLNAYRLTAKVLPKKLQKTYLYNVPLNRVESAWFTKTKDPSIRARIYASRLEELKAEQPPTLLASYYMSRHVNLLALPVPAKTEVKFLHGSLDNIANISSVRKLATLNKTEVIVLDHVGHYLVNEDAKHCAEFFS